jgi:SNF2-related domain/Helicase conserved C-terminal domain/SWIM zinc finger
VASTTIKEKVSVSTAPERRVKKVNVFHQRLGSLTYSQACGLLGDEGAGLLAKGGQIFDMEFDRDVFLGGDLFRVRVEDAQIDGGLAIATITLQSNRNKQLQCNCNVCEVPCRHLGAALNYLLEAKSVLGLAVPPDETVPLEHLTKKELRHRVIADREKRASEEKMTVRSVNTDRPWTDYLVTSVLSGRTYRVALRGFEAGQSYCSCPDYRTNLMETCKHILHVQSKVKKRFSASDLKAYKRKRTSLRVAYGEKRGLLFSLPTKPNDKLIEIVGDAAKRPIQDAKRAMSILSAIQLAGHEVTVYPDAEAFIQRQLVQDRLRVECEKIRANVDSNPLRTELLHAKLLPYQLDGIAFCVGAGRAILADDMGLGKTIQGIGVAELLARLAEIQKVLIICPASLKSQWKSEIGRFSGRSTQIVLGSGADRVQQYANDTFFTICNYEQVLRDLTAIESTPWDLIILDEGQRIKNWESKTSNTIRQLESPFRLVLSGTPLENRLGELFTVMRFVDEHRLGPAYEFFHNYHVVDERGKTLGYRRLDELRETIKPILLRRTRVEVAKQLPERTDEIIRIEPTQEQADICFSHMQIVAQILAKKFMTEMDLLRMQKSLLMARMACDSTYLIDQQEPEYSSKLERLGELLEGLLSDPTRKIVLFSEWRRMLDRIERRLDDFGCEYVRLDGQVPQKKRGEIVARFQNDPECQVILMTNAGSTGLNLQSANTVINVDLPWNPAVLEQRIARAHRMGQKNPVHVYKLVTVGDTIEEKLLTTLASKQDLANAALDMDSEVAEVAMVSGMEDLKKRLEVILNPRPAAAVDESQQRRVEDEAARLNQQREKVAAASGQLITAALSLAGELISAESSKSVDEATVNSLTERLSQCVDHDADGRPQLKITLPDSSALRSLAMTLARLIQQ